MSVGAPSSPALAQELDQYLRLLFPLNRSLTGPGNRETLAILQEIIPLTVHEVPSGAAVYDWVVPDEWSVKGAWIALPDGERVVDFAASNLHLVGYSVPFRGELSWQELAPHLHLHPELPQAVPYRTSYYRRDWGFCLTQEQHERLRQAGGPYTVVVDSELKPGSLSYGELLIPGRSPREILISSYICHPSMANDNLSGVLLTAFLARELLAAPELNYSYRVVLVPETIGALAYCARNQAAMQNIDLGLVVATVGGPGPFGYKQSRDPEHALNRLIEEVLAEAEVEFMRYPFDIHGSDERQYSSQGFGINVATISRDRYYEYPYYHSSLDDLSLVTGAQINETLGLYRALIAKLEARRIYRNRLTHGEAMLSRHGLYPESGGALLPEAGNLSELDLILWLLFLCDGRRSLADIALSLGAGEAVLAELAGRMAQKRLLERV